MFFLGLCALGVIVALIALRATQASVPLVHAGRTATVITTRAAKTASSPRTTQAPTTHPTYTGTAETGTVESATTSAPTSVELVLTASRGDTWIAVRSRSAHGKALFQGTLAKGRTRTFNDHVLWVRFGAAANVDARLNGHPLSLPSGTLSVMITPRGLG